MTGATQSLEAPIQAPDWFNATSLLANQYVAFQVASADGSFICAFAPSQFVPYGTEVWDQIRQRFDLYCMINFLTPSQISSVSQIIHRFRELGSQQPAEATHPLPVSVTTAFNSLSAGAVPPDPEALRLAKSWLESLYGEIRTQEGIWLLPHLTVQDGGDVVFEWWQGQKSLGVYVSAEEVWFLQSAGSNSEQSEGDAGTKEERQGIWQWLTN